MTQGLTNRVPDPPLDFSLIGSLNEDHEIVDQALVSEYFDDSQGAFDGLDFDGVSFVLHEDLVKGVDVFFDGFLGDQLRHLIDITRTRSPHHGHIVLRQLNKHINQLLLLIIRDMRITNRQERRRRHLIRIVIPGRELLNRQEQAISAEGLRVI